MAKIPFTKLGLKLNQDIKTIQFNEQNIEVKQYLPIDQKLNLISNVINLSLEDNINFANPIKIHIYLLLEIIYNYTNITFTEKQKQSIQKTYDLLDSTGLINQVIEAMPKAEYDELIEGVNNSIECLYAYKNSVMGILDTLKTDYSTLDFDATAIQEKIADPENLSLLKEILNKMN